MDWLHVCTTSAGHTWTKKYMEPFIGSHGRTLMDWMCIFVTPAQVIYGSRIHGTFHWRPWSDANGLDASLCYSIFFHYAQGKHERTPIGIHGRTLMGWMHFCETFTIGSWHPPESKTVPVP
jgi:hypothetical protein